MHPTGNTEPEKMYTISIVFKGSSLNIKDAELNAEDARIRLEYLCSKPNHFIELEDGNVLAIPKNTHIDYYFVATLKGEES